jgi:hypothetical protein
MELNIQKTKIRPISFTRKTNRIHFNYCVSDVLLLRSYCVKDLDAVSDSKIYFHCHVNFVYSQTLRPLGLFRYITYNFSSLDNIVVLYNVLIRSKLEYVSVVGKHSNKGTELLLSCIKNHSG